MYRELKKSQVIQEIKFLTRTHEAAMIFVLEPMVNEKDITTIILLMGYDDFDYVLPTNYPGC